jgi:hypothetical protein
MRHSPFSQEEFDRLFPGPFPSEQDRQGQYEAFCLVLEQLDQEPVPELPASLKAEIFRLSWRHTSRDRSWIWAWPALLRRPAVTFALGLALGCLAMFGWMRQSPEPPVAVEAEPSFTVEHTGQTKVYQGQLIQKLYPKIENPRIIVEKTSEAAEPQRVLQGTLDNGEIYVAWNL